jgi:3-oxoadipate enol-lactonase
MYFADIDGAKIHYRFDGPTNAPVVLLSNSLGTDLSMWEPQIPTFSSRFRTLRYDTRGHGRSTVTPGPYSIELLANDVLTLLDQLKIENVYYCGLSLGGMVGIWLAINRPDRIRKLVLSNTAARIGPPEFWDSRVNIVRTTGMPGVVPAVLARWFTPEYLQQSPDSINRFKRILENTPVDGYCACCLAIRDADLSGSLSCINMPTLVITGKRDAATKPSDGKFLADSIKGAYYLEFEAAHLSNVEVQYQFTDAVLKFFTREP